MTAANAEGDASHGKKEDVPNHPEAATLIATILVVAEQIGKVVDQLTRIADALEAQGEARDR